jgi:hypothetical protein
MLFKTNGSSPINLKGNFLLISTELDFHRKDPFMMLNTAYTISYRVVLQNRIRIRIWPERSSIRPGLDPQSCAEMRMYLDMVDISYARRSQVLWLTHVENVSQCYGSLPSYEKI